jgi:hypothetical protein
MCWKQVSSSHSSKSYLVGSLPLFPLALPVALLACGAQTSGSGVGDAGGDGSADAVGFASEGGDATIDAAADSSDGDALGDAGTNMVPDVGVPPIDPSVPLHSLTPAQESAICDWKNAATGGYGMNWKCAMNDTSNASCVANLSRFLPTYCGQTVGDEIACVYAELAELPACDFPAECEPLVSICNHGEAGAEMAPDATADSAPGE